MKLNNRGQMLIVISVIIAIVFATFVFTLYFMTRVNVTASMHDRLAARAIEVCDVGISQMIGDIHRHNVNLTLLPATTTYAIVKYPDSDKTEQVEAILSEVPDINDVDGDGNTTDPETDLAGNTIYQIDSRSWGSLFYGERLVRRHVAARIAIVNLARYNLFYRGNDIWANGSTLGGGQPIMLDGPYHTNGNLELGGVIYFNNQNLPINPGSNNWPGGTANASYNQSYTVMCARQISQAGGYPANNTFTQNNQFGRVSSHAAYSVVPNATRPRGTWFDGAHGGFEIQLEALDFVKYQALAQVIIEYDNLPDFSVYGINHTSTGLVIANGAGDQTIDIDLSQLGSGTTKDICFGMVNYQNALNSYYGLIIFVNGPVSVHGQIAACPGAENNKKITIISTDSIDIIGDVLYSRDPYLQTLDSFTTNAAVNAWNVDTTNADCDTKRETDPAKFTGAPYKNIDNSCMEAKIKHTSSPGQRVVLKKHFDIVPPPPGINNSKIFFNIRGNDPGDNIDVALQLIDTAHNVIASTGPVTISGTSWRRIVLVNNTPSTTLSLGQINSFNNHTHDNLEIVFTNFDGNDRKFYIDELCFAFGKSYPIDAATTNPTNDAIALISQDNQFENAFYLTGSSNQYTNNMYADSIKYFAVNGDYQVSGNCYRDLRIDAFIYTALDNTMFTVHTNQWLDMFTQYGSSCSFLGGTVRAPVFNNTFDPNLANNVSKAIPVGTVIHSYQQLK
ncbi:MAG: hypothetical protein PHV60_03320 [bacterium]|nr:hypothetical protein [bacterium]